MAYLDTGRSRVGDGVGEQPSRELVVPRGEGDADFARRAAVHLRRPARAGACPSAEPSEVDLQQSVLREAVQVVGGDGALQVRGGGSLVPTDPVAGADHIVVQGAPVGLAQGADRAQRVEL